MTERITFMLDEDVAKKLRTIQAKMIQTDATSVSFSKVINEVLKNALKQ